jgi:short-subunit dehydrogenase
MLSARPFAEDAASDSRSTRFYPVDYKRQSRCLLRRCGACWSKNGNEPGTERNTKMKQHSKGLAVVTGASSGIGAVYAGRLARRGYDLLLVARNQLRMADLAKKLVSETGSNVDILAADRTDSDDVVRLEQFFREDSRVTLLVNNAGVAATAPLLKSDVAAMSRMLALNVEAVTRLTYAAAPAFVKRGAGVIINIAAVVAA